MWRKRTITIYNRFQSFFPSFLIFNFQIGGWSSYTLPETGLNYSYYMLLYRICCFNVLWICRDCIDTTLLSDGRLLLAILVFPLMAFWDRRRKPMRGMLLGHVFGVGGANGWCVELYSFDLHSEGFSRLDVSSACFASHFQTKFASCVICEAPWRSMKRHACWQCCWLKFEFCRSSHCIILICATYGSNNTR